MFLIKKKTFQYVFFYKLKHSEKKLYTIGNLLKLIGKLLISFGIDKTETENFGNLLILILNYSVW